MSYEAIQFKMKDGHQLDGNLYIGEEKSPLLIMFPALGVEARYYKNFSEALQKQGYNILLVDLRGNGGSSLRVSRKVDFGYNEILTYDYPQIMAEMKKRFPENKFILMGHSLGGQLSSLYTSIDPKAIAGIVLLASCSVYFMGFPKKIKTLMETQFVGAISRIIGYFPGKKIGFAGTEAKSLMLDWSRNARTGKYIVKNNPHNFEQTLKEMQTKVLALSFEHDHLAPPSAVEELTKKFEKSEIDHQHIKASEIGLSKVNHFNWVKRHGPVVTKIDEWIRKHHA